MKELKEMTPVEIENEIKSIRNKLTEMEAQHSISEDDPTTNELLERALALQTEWELKTNPSVEVSRSNSLSSIEMEETSGLSIDELESMITGFRETIDEVGLEGPQRRQLSAYFEAMVKAQIRNKETLDKIMKGDAIPDEIKLKGLPNPEYIPGLRGRILGETGERIKRVKTITAEDGSTREVPMDEEDLLLEKNPEVERRTYIKLLQDNIQYCDNVIVGLNNTYNDPEYLNEAGRVLRGKSRSPLSGKTNFDEKLRLLELGKKAMDSVFDPAKIKDDEAAELIALAKIKKSDFTHENLQKSALALAILATFAVCHKAIAAGIGAIFAVKAAETVLYGAGTVFSKIGATLSFGDPLTNTLAYSLIGTGALLLDYSRRIALDIMLDPEKAIQKKQANQMKEDIKEQREKFFDREYGKKFDEQTNKTKNLLDSLLKGVTAYEEKIHKKTIVANLDRGEISKAASIALHKLQKELGPLGEKIGNITGTLLKNMPRMPNLGMADKLAGIKEKMKESTAKQREAISRHEKATAVASKAQQEAYKKAIKEYKEPESEEQKQTPGLGGGSDNK